MVHVTTPRAFPERPQSAPERNDPQRLAISTAANLLGAQRKSSDPQRPAFSTVANLFGAQWKSSDPQTLAFSTAASALGMRLKSSISKATEIGQQRQTQSTPTHTRRRLAQTSLNIYRPLKRLIGSLYI